MQTIDQALQERVWQRVAGSIPAADPSVLLTLIVGEWTDAVAYRQLSRQYKGNQAALLGQVFRQKQAQIACLKGIYYILTGHPAIVKPSPLPRLRPEDTLRRSYQRQMQRLDTYRQWSRHPEFGAVFAKLYFQIEAHCGILLELLGKNSAT